MAINPPLIAPRVGWGPGDAEQIVVNTVETFHFGLSKKKSGADCDGEGLPSGSGPRYRVGLTADEMAFYDALTANEASTWTLGDTTLRKIARELTGKLRASNSVDWYVRDSVRVKLRLMVKTTLKKWNYPPDGQDRATETVLEQAKALSAAWATV
jgi:hypothetical protein